MKCPNCSFNNAAHADICKVCGHEFSLKEAKKIETPKIEPSHLETQTENVLNDLFGEPESEVYEINLSERTMTSQKEHGKPIRLLAFLTAVLILMLFGFVLFWPKLSELGWFKGNVPEATKSGQVETPEEKKTPHDQFIDDFFDAFVKDINAKTLSAKSLNLSPAQVDAYHSLGPILSFTHEAPTLILSSGNQKTYEIASIFIHKTNDATKETPILFKFSIKEADSLITFESLYSDYANKNVAEVELEPEEAEATEETKETPASEVETVKEEEEKESQSSKEIPKGFMTSGSFKGGLQQENLRLDTIRYGNNVSFERIVLDLSTANSEAPSAASVYKASVTEDGKSLLLTVEGISELKASTSPLKGIKSIKESVISHDATSGKVTFKVTLNSKGAFKVFNMTSPGKIVVDFIEL